MPVRVKVLNSVKYSPEKLLFPVLGVIAFFIPLLSPVSDALTYLVLAMLIANVIAGRRRNRTVSVETKRMAVLGSSLFLLTFVYVFFSDDRSAIYAQMDQFTALLVFPLMITMLSPEKAHRRQVNLVLNIFVAGTVISTMLLFLLGLIRMLKTGDSSELYYINLGNGVHPSYMSVLVVFAIAVLLDGNTLKRIMRYTTPVSFFIIPVVLWLIVFNTMLSSKAGIIVQGMVILLFILRAFFTGDLYRGFLYTGLLIASLMVIPVLFPFTFNRFSQFSETISENKTVSDIDINETTNSRILGWNAAFDLIREHPFLGVGPDGVREELKTAYEDHGLDYGYRNPHNQYLQTWLELGLPGLILLLSMGLVSVFLAIRERNYIFFAFLMILYTHMLFESILERRLGILIFAFWLSIFWIASDLRFRSHAKE